MKLPKAKLPFQGLLHRLNAILPEPLKGKGRLPIMTISFFLVAAVIAAVNWRLHTIRVDIQRKAESQELAVARIPEIRKNISEELEAAEQLASNRNTVYAMLPSLANVPVIVHQLEELGRKAGGETNQVEYAPLQQRTARIEVQFRVQFSGDYGDCLRYMYNIVASFPTIALRQIVLERPADDSGWLSLNLELVLAALESRPSSLPSWDFGRMVAFPVTPLGHPFDAPAQVERDNPKAVVELSGWTLKGIMNNGGEKRALFEVNGRTQWLTVGDEIEGAELVKVAEGVAHLWSAGRIFTFRLQGR